jgi:hypothetical protein
MNNAERRIHAEQQSHIADVWDRNVTGTCELIEAEHIERDAQDSEYARLRARPYRVIHELPRKHGVNGYTYDV